MRALSRAAIASLSLLLAGAPAVAQHRHHGPHAPPPDPAQVARQTEARGHFQRGGQFYESSDWAHAIEEFRAAFDLWPNPVILFNLAQAYRRDGQLSQAIETFNRYLETAPNLTREQRAEVEEAVHEIEETRAVITFEVEPAGATVTLNGRDYGTAPIARNAEVLPGEYRVHVELADHASRDETFTVRAHEQRLVNVRLRPVDQNARLVVNVSPADASILIDGESAGTGHAQRQVRPGRYTVTASREGYRDETQTVTVAQLRTETVGITLRPRTRSIVTRPWFWGVVGGVVAAGALTAIIITSVSDPSPIEGNGNPSVVQTATSF
jgi:hypothetical protein